jgi:hypothetical protein
MLLAGRKTSAMLLLGSRSSTLPDQNVWTARADFCAGADQVLRALTDPELIAQWAPVAFNVAGLAGGRLSAGSRERVSGTIAGVRATFDVQVARADLEGLELSARGPLAFGVVYSFREYASGVRVEARLSLGREGGLATQVLRAAVRALLNAGALAGALRRLEASLCPACEPELVAA